MATREPGEKPSDSAGLNDQRAKSRAGTRMEPGPGVEVMRVEVGLSALVDARVTFNDGRVP